MVDVIASGHVCLDLLPAMDTVPLEGMAAPGKLFEIGALDMSTGGSVSNTGLALHRLGVDVGLMGSVGDDMLGRIIIALFKDIDATLAEFIRVREGAATSYSVLMSPQNSDRIIFHSTGANESFSTEDVDLERVVGAKLFHLGYPPLLPSLLKNDGAPLTDIFSAVKEMRILTSLDTAMPDPGKYAGAGRLACHFAKCPSIR
jgi:sugar/nucleoside kinase (ribokinase family)